MNVDPLASSSTLALAIPPSPLSYVSTSELPSSLSLPSHLPHPNLKRSYPYSSANSNPQKQPYTQNRTQNFNRNSATAYNGNSKYRPYKSQGQPAKKPNESGLTKSNENVPPTTTNESTEEEKKDETTEGSKAEAKADPTIMKERKKPKLLKASDLKSKDGIPKLLSSFPHLPLKGTGYEGQDLRTLLNAYKQWAFILHPKKHFSVFSARVEKFGTLHEIRDYMVKLRNTVHKGTDNDDGYLYDEDHVFNSDSDKYDESHVLRSRELGVNPWTINQHPTAVYSSNGTNTGLFPDAGQGNNHILNNHPIEEQNEPQFMELMPEEFNDLDIDQPHTIFQSESIPENNQGQDAYPLLGPSS